MKTSERLQGNGIWISHTLHVPAVDFLSGPLDPEGVCLCAEDAMLLVVAPLGFGLLAEEIVTFPLDVVFEVGLLIMLGAFLEAL